MSLAIYRAESEGSYDIEGMHMRISVFTGCTSWKAHFIMAWFRINKLQLMQQFFNHDVVRLQKLKLSPSG